MMSWLCLKAVNEIQRIEIRNKESISVQGFEQESKTRSSTGAVRYKHHTTDIQVNGGWGFGGGRRQESQNNVLIQLVEEKRNVITTFMTTRAANWSQLCVFRHPKLDSRVREQRISHQCRSVSGPYKLTLINVEWPERRPTKQEKRNSKIRQICSKFIERKRTERGRRVFSWFDIIDAQRLHSDQPSEPRNNNAAVNCEMENWKFHTPPPHPLRLMMRGFSGVEWCYVFFCLLFAQSAALHWPTSYEVRPGKGGHEDGENEDLLRCESNTWVGAIFFLVFFSCWTRPLLSSCLRLRAWWINISPLRE